MESMNFGDSDNIHLVGMIKDIIFTEDLKKKLEGTLFIIHSLDEETHNQVDAENFEKYILKFLNDREFMRKLQNISIMKNNVEMAMEYTGEDYINMPEYAYNYEMETKLKDISLEISKFLGNTMKTLTGEEGLEL